MVKSKFAYLEFAVDRITRKELKTDKFAAEVTSTVEYVASHRTQVFRYAAVALGVLVVAIAGWYWMRQQHEARQRDLAEALRTVNAAVGVEPNPTIKIYPSQAEKDKAVEKALTDLAAKHSGSDESAMATYLLGTNFVDRGKTVEGEKFLRTAADSGRKEYASMAKLALADLLASQGKIAESEKLLRELMANPTTLVSKEQATLSLARVLSKTRKDEALKLLEPLRTQTGATSRAAISAYSDISQMK